jgi:hypothetical protein
VQARVVAWLQTLAKREVVGVKEPDKEICSALDEVGKTFEENELAYLAATCKIEFPFRDRLAFLLHKGSE